MNIEFNTKSPKLNKALDILGKNNLLYACLDRVNHASRQAAIDTIMDFLNDYDRDMDLGSGYLGSISSKVYSHLKNSK